MIRLGPRPAAPSFFQSEDFAGFVNDLWEFHQAGGTAGTQRHFSWRKHLDPFMSEAMSALHDYFQGKCAYTEAPLGEKESAQFVLHRPASDAVGLKGSSSPDHYWWFIPVWSNWYVASGSTARVKENRFPVDGERAPVPTSPTDPYESEERSLLLDPCEDDPVWYLQFWRTGFVGACDVERGKAWHSRRLPVTLPHPGIQTILTLDLNNERLTEARKRAASQTPEKLKQLLLTDHDSGTLHDLLSRDQPFAAAVRQSAALGLLGIIAEDKRTALPEQLNEPVIRALAKELWAELAVALICPQGKGRRIAPSEAELLASLIAPHVELAKGPEVQARLLEALGRGPIKMRARAGEPAKESEEVEEAEDDAEQAQGPVIDLSSYVKALHIQNFKGIRDVRVDTADLEGKELNVGLEPAWGTDEVPISTARRWWAFLGENGSGKSSILQAVGLALAGKNLDQVMGERQLAWRDLHRRPPEGSDEDVPEGRICLDFSNGIRIDLRFNTERHWWVPDTRDMPEDAPELPPEAGIPDIQTFVRGYGATRLLESSVGDPERRLKTGQLPRSVRISNLFDPRAYVIDAEHWLLGLDQTEFNKAAPTIANLLEDHRAAHETGLGKAEAQEDEEEWILTRKEDRVLVEGLPLSLVSDGYRAIVAMLCDIMAGLADGVSNMQGATGIVLVDEIGAHLHPRWRMAITRKLRRALPQMQFIVSTHEPLCLRGLVAKEVVRVQKDAKYGVTAEVVDRNPSNYRVDQLLTSEFFGLETTIDPDIERRFHHYYQLLAIPDTERNPEQTEKFEKLRSYLYEHAKPSFGFTRRDQLVCDEIDQFLSQEYQQKLKSQSHEEVVEDRKAQRKKTIEKIKDIWHLRRAAHGVEDGP